MKLLSFLAGLLALSLLATAPPTFAQEVSAECPHSRPLQAYLERLTSHSLIVSLEKVADEELVQKLVAFYNLLPPLSRVEADSAYIAKATDGSYAFILARGDKECAVAVTGLEDPRELMKEDPSSGSLRIEEGEA